MNQLFVYQRYLCSLIVMFFTIRTINDDVMRSWRARPKQSLSFLRRGSSKREEKKEKRQIYSFDVFVCLANSQSWAPLSSWHDCRRCRHRFERRESFTVIKRLVFFTILNKISFIRLASVICFDGYDRNFPHRSFFRRSFNGDGMFVLDKNETLRKLWPHLQPLPITSSSSSSSSFSSEMCNIWIYVPAQTHLFHFKFITIKKWQEFVRTYIWLEKSLLHVSLAWSWSLLPSTCNEKEARVLHKKNVRTACSHSLTSFCDII